MKTWCRAGMIKNSIIGIGLNINQEAFPPHLPHAVSVKQILHQDYDLKTLLADICRNIEAYYLNLKAGKIDFVRNTYLNRLYWINEVKNFKTAQGRFTGTIKTVKDNGLLVVTDNNNKQTEFNLKEIEFLNK